MKRNVASQAIGAQMITAADGSAFTGSVTVYVTGDAGTQAAGSVGSGACTHEGNGYHTYAPDQAETNYDLIAFTFTGSGAIPVTIQVFTTYPQTGDSFARLGAPAGASVSADVAAVKADTAAVLDDTGTSGVIVGSIANNAITDAAINADAITAAKVAADVHQELIELAFTYDATATYGTADAGSLVVQIADNAGGSALTEAGIADAVWDELLSGHTVSGSSGEALAAAGTAGDPWTTALPGAYGAGTAGYLIGTNMDAPVSTVDTVVDAIKAKTDNLPSDPADESLIIAATDALSAILGSPAGASMSADIAAIKSDTGSILTDTAEIGAAGAGLSAVPWNAAWDAEVQSECTDALNAYDPPTNAEMVAATGAIETDTQDIQSRLPAALTGAGNMKADALAINGETEGASRFGNSTQGIVTGTCDTGCSTTSIVTSALSPAAAVADQFKGRIMTFLQDTTTAALRGQSTDIKASTDAGVLTVTELTTAPASGDIFVIT